MADREPDLTSELDAAEDVVMHGAIVVTEWGVRYYPDRPDFIWLIGGDEGHEETARSLAARCEQRGQGSALMRRTVTYGPWREPGNKSAQPAATREDEAP
jgi:hypothetical protein